MMIVEISESGIADAVRCHKTRGCAASNPVAVATG